MLKRPKIKFEKRIANDRNGRKWDCFPSCVYFRSRNTLENFQLKRSLPDDVMLSRAKWNNVNHAFFTSKLSMAFRSTLSLITLAVASLMLTDAFRDSEMASTLTKGLRAGFAEGARRLLCTQWQCRAENAA